MEKELVKKLLKEIENRRKQHVRSTNGLKSLFFELPGPNEKYSLFFKGDPHKLEGLNFVYRPNNSIASSAIETGAGNQRPEWCLGILIVI